MTAAQRAEAPWWRGPFRMFQTNLREIDAGTLDVRETLDFIEDYGANVWLLSVGGIISNYPTDIEDQRRNPALAERASGDLVGDVTRAANERGVHVMARMDFSKVDRARAERHPEWCFVDPDGEWQTYNGLTSVCPSGDYYQSVIFDVVSEVLDRYPIDGFFFNWWTFNEYDYARRYRGVCHCSACRRGFAAFAPETPHPVERGSVHYETWTAYTRAVLDDLGARMRAHIAARAPHVAFVQVGDADIVFHEANNALGRELWHHRTADQVSASRTAHPQVPVLTHSVAFFDLPYRLASEEPEHFAQHLLQGIARGGNPSTYIMGAPADSPYECLAVGGEITRFHRDHVELYTGARSEARVVLVRPDDLAHRQPVFSDVSEEFYGIHSMLVQSHVPFDVLDARMISDADLSARTLVILADLGELPSDSVAHLDRFVREGGHVMTTGSSAFTASGAQLERSPVERVVAVFDEPRALMGFHVRLHDDAWGDPVAVVGNLRLVAAQAGARSCLSVLGRAPFGPPEKCYGYDPNGQFGAHFTTGGPGGVGTVLWTIGRSWWASGADRIRRSFLDLIEQLIGASVALGGRSSESLEVVLSQSAAGPVAHLLNRTGDRSNRFAKVTTLMDQTLELPWQGVTSVRAIVSGAVLRAEPTPAGVRVTVPSVDRFEVLVAGCPQPSDVSAPGVG